jgi:hypothetical protein
MDFALTLAAFILGSEAALVVFLMVSLLLCDILKLNFP